MANDAFIWNAFRFHRRCVLCPCYVQCSMKMVEAQFSISFGKISKKLKITMQWTFIGYYDQMSALYCIYNPYQLCQEKKKRNNKHFNHPHPTSHPFHRHRSVYSFAHTFYNGKSIQFNDDNYYVCVQNTWINIHIKRVKD